jgi:large subunit ribosomal protein L7/L12
MATKSFESIIDTIKGLTVIELNDLVKQLEQEFGVSAAMPTAAAAPAAAAGEAPQAEAAKSEFKVILKDGGAEKIKTIKALRQVTSLGLTEAKQAVEGTPFVIAEAAAKDVAANMKKVLEEAGAKVELA